MCVHACMCMCVCLFESIHVLSMGGAGTIDSEAAGSLELAGQLV